MSAACPRVLVLNGGSSSGKSSLARSLQDLLDGYWLRLGVDTLIEAAPAKLLGVEGLHLADDGSVGVGADFVEVERQWRAGVAAMAAAGAHIVVEDNFVSGPVAQRRWQDALRETQVGWVGVRCAPEIAAAREAHRGDRTVGMAASQADSVHRGIAYDLVVDTGVTGPADLALIIRAHFFDGTQPLRSARGQGGSLSARPTTP